MDEAFEKSLKDIAAVITGSRESINLFWRSVFDYGRDNIPFFQINPPVLKVFCPFLLKSLMDYGCYDHKTLLKVLNIYQRGKIVHWKWIENRCHRSNSYDIHDVPYVIKSLSEDSSEDSEDTMLLSAAEDMRISFDIADVNLTKVLLKEGMLRPFKTDATGYHDFRSLLRQVLESLEVLVIYVMVGLHRLTGPFKNAIMINYAIEDEYVEKCLTSDYADRTFRRKCMTAYVVKTVMMKYWNYPSCTKPAECLLLYYRALPDPFITREEVQDFLHRYIHPEFWKEDAFESCCDIYDNLFHPDLSSHYRPRSLKHLCRCTVRDVLVQKKVILSDLESILPEVTFLKDFLLGGPENAFY